VSFSVRPGVPEEKTTIHSLLQPYLDELCRFPGEIAEYKDEYGVYQYPYLDAYWQETERLPYLIFVEEKPAGFALVSKYDDQWNMAEFYIKPELRRRGLGEAAALDILSKHPGLWQISFNRHNSAGQKLWYKLAGKSAKGEIVEGHLDANHEYLRFPV
jgi:predicted acetyltransferase